MTVIRVLISLFVLLLIVVSAAGWIWAGSHQPPGQATASHLVLGLGMLAGVVCLVLIWRRPRT